MDKSDWVTLLVAVLSLVATILVNRQSARIARGNNNVAIVNARTDAETEAYIRARTMDTETINRQGNELKEIRVELDELRDKYDTLEGKYDDVLGDNRRLRERIVELERSS